MKKIFTALIITNILTWSLSLGAYLTKIPINTIPFILAISMWIPGLIALFFAKREGIDLKFFSKPSKTVLIASLAALLSIFVIFSINSPFASLDIIKTDFPQLFERVTSNKIWWYLPIFIIVGLFSGMTINMLFALGEEIMWRGYLFEKLKHLGFLKANIVIGVFWGLWHAPAIVLFGHNNHSDINPFIAVIMMVLFCISLSCPMSYYYLRGRKTIMVPAAFHGTINAFAPIFILFFNKKDFTVWGPTGIVGIMVLGMFSLYTLRKTQTLSEETAQIKQKLETTEKM